MNLSLDKGPGDNSTKPGITHIALPLLLAIVAFLVYVPSLNNGFVWDDTGIIQNNQKIHLMTSYR